MSSYTLGGIRLALFLMLNDFLIAWTKAYLLTYLVSE